MADFDDFLALPFLDQTSLISMGVDKDDVHILFSSILKFRSLSSYECKYIKREREMKKKKN